jgi:hypothetical protein
MTVPSLAIALMSAMTGIAQDKKPPGRDELKRVQEILTRYYVPQTVTLTQDLPYIKRAAVITADSVSTKTITPENRVEEYYGKAGARCAIRKVDVQTTEAVFTLYPVYLDGRLLPTPPINPNDPPFEPQPLPVPRNSGGLGGVFKRKAISLTVVVQYASPEELDADKLQARLKPVFEFVNSR